AAFALLPAAARRHHGATAASTTRCLPPEAAAQIASSAQYPSTWPYTRADFARYDETVDTIFYSSPRLTRHIDERAVAALRRYYATELLPRATHVLDLCSSLESYMPPPGALLPRVTALGLNAEEMRANDALHTFVVRDVNAQPVLPFDDAAFDLVLCALSVDYLTRPRELMREVARVLRRGGRAAFSFSDRVFSTKAVALWMSGANEDHIYTVASYFHYTPGFGNIEALDLSPRTLLGACSGDVLYVVSAQRV
ncbi:unnamed protein product, partial [Agarophyton chilense]